MSAEALDPKRRSSASVFLVLAAMMIGAGPVKTAAVRPSMTGVVLLGGALMIGVLMAYRLWRETHQDEEPIRGVDQLSDFEQAFAAGKMNEAEFRRIRELLIGTPGKTLTKLPRGGPEPSPEMTVERPAPGDPLPPHDPPIEPS